MREGKCDKSAKYYKAGGIVSDTTLVGRQGHVELSITSVPKAKMTKKMNAGGNS